MSTALAPSPTVPLAPSLLSEAKERCTRLLLAEDHVRDSLHALCVATWHFGQTISALKERGGIGHGNWMFFVAAHFPELSPVTPRDGEPIDEAEARACSTRVKRVGDAKAFFEANPNYPSSGNFDEESIRKCVLRIAPKSTPELPGDQKVQRGPTPLTFCNQLHAFRERVKEGLAIPPPLETLRADFREPIQIIAELCGRDYVLSLLAEPA